MPEPQDAPPADAAPFTRDYTATVDDVSASGRYVVARINTGGVDRFGTVIQPAGMRQAEFERNNRLVLWEHGKDPTRGRLPIGRSAWVKYRKDRDDLVARTDFAKDDYSQAVFELYRDNVLRAWSINGNPSAAPGACGPPTAAEVRRNADWAGVKKVYRAWDLTEYSGVTIPGNADALTEEVGRSVDLVVARGLWVPAAVLELARAARPTPPPKPTPALPPLRGRTLEDVQAAFLRRFDEAADRMVRSAVQDALDLARGRV